MCCSSDTRRGRAGAVALLLLLSLACADRSRRNPLDPGADVPRDDLVGELHAVAGDGQVRISWDYTHYADINGYYLYRSMAGGAFLRHPDRVLNAATTGYVDQAVVNDQVYEYRLGLLVDGEDERILQHVAAATPGAEIVWAGDRASGYVWQIAPDCRSAGFSYGPFTSLAGMDVDPVDGSCWVVDRYVHGLYRLNRDGGLELWKASVEEPGRLAVDPLSGRVWLIDHGSAEVRWFDPVRGGDSVGTRAADARLVDPVGLAPQANGCWIADRAVARVLYLHPDGRRFDFEDIPGVRAMAAGSAGGVWVLADQGRMLVRLGWEGRGSYVDLGFVAEDLGVDAGSGHLWVVGADGVVLLNGEGRQLERYEGPAAGRSIALDALHGAVWVAGGGEMWKLSGTGEPLSILSGFAALLRVVVLPKGGAELDTSP